MGKFIGDVEGNNTESNGETGPHDVFVCDSNTVSHFIETPSGEPYHIVENTLHLGRHTKNTSTGIPLKPGFGKIVVGCKYVFVAYEKSVEVLRHSGKLFRRFVGNSIECSNGLFLITESNISYVIDSEANAVFTRSRRNTIDFTERGEIAYLADELEQNSGRHLVIESLKDLRRYDAPSDPIFEIENISVYENSAVIRNVVCCTHLYLEESSTDPCFVVLCADEIFILFRSYVARKQISRAYTKIDPEEFVAHNYLEQESFYELVLALSLFTDIRIGFPDLIEGFLCKLILHRRAAGPFIGRILSSYGDANRDASDRIVCRAYRRVDDRAKAMLDAHIEISRLSVDCLYYIIIYRLEHIDHFVKLCIEKKRLFYLRELVPFFEKIDRLDELRGCLLRNRLFILDCKGLERIIAMEKMEIDSQESVFRDS